MSNINNMLVEALPSFVGSREREEIESDEKILQDLYDQYAKGRKLTDEELQYVVTLELQRERDELPSDEEKAKFDKNTKRKYEIIKEIQSGKRNIPLSIFKDLAFSERRRLAKRKYLEIRQRYFDQKPTPSSSSTKKAPVLVKQSATSSPKKGKPVIIKPETKNTKPNDYADKIREAWRKDLKK